MRSLEHMMVSRLIYPLYAPWQGWWAWTIRLDKPLHPGATLTLNSPTMNNTYWDHSNMATMHISPERTSVRIAQFVQKGWSSPYLLVIVGA